MPSLDIRTLSFLSMISSLLLAVGLQLVNRLITRDPSLRLWASGASVSAAGYVLFAVRGIVPDLLSIVVGNTLLVIGTVWLYLGNRSFRGLKNEFPWYWLLAAATAALLCYFTYLMPSLSARIITLSAALAMVLLPGAFVWLHPGDSADRMVRWFVGGASLAAALLLGMRAVMTPFMASPGQDFMAVASPVHTLTLVMGISLNIVLGIGLPLLVSGRLQRRVMESEERFRTIADYTFGWEYWLGTHEQLLYVNAACERISGYSPKEFGADPGLFDRIVHAEDRPAYEEHLRWTDGQKEAHIEFRIATRTGEVRWIAHGCRAVFSQDGRPLGRRISNRDITDLKNAEEQARQLAFFDSLTNLPNRRMLLDRLNLGLSQARRFKRSLAVMFLDLDHFKDINDTLGHDMGDSLLREVASRLSACLRAGDTVARTGGDEFIIVLPEIADAQAATVVAEKIVHAIRRPVCIGGHALDITISIGIAIHEANAAHDAAELMKNADIAMYQAKQAGRNGYRVFEEATA